MHLLVKKCLQQCEKLGAKSVAFPAIGSGALGFPPAVLAKIMVDEISDFLATRASFSLKAVHLVIFVEDDHKKFKEALAQPAVPSAVSHTPAAEPRPAATASYAARAKPQAKTRSKMSCENFGTADVLVQVVHGDITESKSDIVVNSTNREMKLEGYGVSAALLRKGGPQLQEACNAAITADGGVLSEGRVIATKATGSLKCGTIFHTVFESKDEKKLTETVNACLNKAEGDGLQSIAFPAIGTGVHGYPPEKAARVMIAAFKSFAETKNPNSLKCLRVVLFNVNIYKTFAKEFKKSKNVHTNPGLFERFKQFFSSMNPFARDEEEEEEEGWESGEDLAGSHLTDFTSSVVCVSIYGRKDQSVKDAWGQLEGIINNQFVSNSIDDPNIDALPRSVIQSLKQDCLKQHVEIEIDKAPLNRITLKGNKFHLSQMKERVHKALADFEKKCSNQREAEMMQKITQWQRQDSQGTFQDYEPEINLEIEQAYERNDHQYSHDSGIDKFVIDFGKNEECNHMTRQKTIVKRVDLKQTGMCVWCVFGVCLAQQCFLYHSRIREA